MPQLVALLRGINVGKAKRVAMADLRTLLTDLGFENPRTLLNSGNAVFGATAAQAATAAATIQAGIAEQLDVECAVLTRTQSQFATSVKNNPLLDQVTDPARHLVGYLSATLPAATARELESGDYGADQLRFVGAQAYLWCASGILASPLSKLNWTKLGVDMTGRNWTTVLKLNELAAG